jgi:tape measure domain-containing protein
MAGKEYRLTILVSGRDSGAKSMLGGIGSALGSIGKIAGGILAAGFFVQLANQVKEFAVSAIQATAEIQRMEMMLTTLQAREFIKTGQFTDMNAALAAAAPLAKATMDQLQRIAVISPYQLETVNNTYRLAMAFGYTSKEATVFTKALLDMAAGVGADSGMLDRMAYNLAQVRLQGKVTALDIRQLAMAGLDLNDVLKYVGKQMGINIKDHNDFNKALEQGKITWEDFTKYFGEYADKNFGGAAERMSKSLYGLWSTFKDLFALSMPKILGPAVELVTTLLNDMFTSFNDFIESGTLEQWGKNVADFVGPGIEVFRDLLEVLGLLDPTLVLGEDGWLRRAPNMFDPLIAAMDKFKQKILDFDISGLFSDMMKSLEKIDLMPLINSLIDGLNKIDWHAMEVTIRREMTETFRKAFQIADDFDYQELSDNIVSIFDNIDWNKLGNALNDHFKTVMQFISFGAELGRKITWDFITNMDWQAITIAALNGLGEFIAGLLGASSAEALIAKWRENFTRMVNTLDEVKPIAVGKIKTLIFDLVSALIGAAPQMVLAVLSWLPGINGALSRLVALFLQKGTAMANQLIIALQGMTTRVVNAIREFMDKLRAAVAGGISIGVGVSIPWGKLDEFQNFIDRWNAIAASASGFKGGKSTGGGGGGGGGGGACFTAKTLVTLSDGRKVRFDEIHVGQKVMSYDTTTQEFTEARIEKVFVHKPDEINGYYIFNYFLQVTGEHKIFVNGAWIDARDIQIGDELIDQSGNIVRVKIKQFVDAQVPTYNLHTDHETHNYFADGILVHNSANKGFADGGISSGPSSGYQALLHGTEAVIPLKGGAVPVALMGGLNPSMGGNSTPVVIQFTYAPAVSLASKYEAQDVIAPMLQEALRTEFTKRGM